MLSHWLVAEPQTQHVAARAWPLGPTSTPKAGSAVRVYLGVKGLGTQVNRGDNWVMIWLRGVISIFTISPPHPASRVTGMDPEVAGPPYKGPILTGSFIGNKGGHYMRIMQGFHSLIPYYIKGISATPIPKTRTL